MVVIVIGTLLCFLLGGPVIAILFLVSAVCVRAVGLIGQGLQGKNKEDSDRIVPIHKTMFVKIVLVIAAVALIFHFIPRGIPPNYDPRIGAMQPKQN